MAAFDWKSGMIIGIDPGVTGAIAVIDRDKVTLYDMPVQNKGKPTRKRSKKTGQMITSQKKEIDPWALINILTFYHGEIHFFLENVSAGAFGKDKHGEQRTQGVSSAFSFGDSFGVIRAVCAFIVPKSHLHLVRPQEWKKTRGLVGLDKDAARLMARGCYPNYIKFLERKKDIGRADALMIADHGRHVIEEL